MKGKITTWTLLDRILRLCLCLIGAAISAVSAAEPAVLTDKLQEYGIGRNLDDLEDKTGKLELRDILKSETAARFMQSQSDSPNFGITESSYWLRFTLKNLSSRENWLLVLDHSLMDHITLYTPGDKGYTARKAGDLLPFGTREFKNRNFVFHIDLKPDENKTYFVELRSESSMPANLTVWSPDAFASYDHDQQYAMGIYYGILLVMIFYNLFLFFSLRDRSYLYYIIFILCIFLFSLSLNGLAYEYLWPNLVWWNNRTDLFFAGAASLTSLAFARSFLMTPAFAPRLDKAMVAMMLACGGFLVFMLFGSYRTGNHIAAFFPILATLLVIPAGIISYAKKYHPARFFLIAIASLAGGFVLFSLKLVKVLPPGFITNYGFHIGSAGQVILLSLGLADRINSMKREKEQAQRQALETQIQLADSYARFVPRQFLINLGKKSILEVQLGDQIQKEMAIMFADIRSFTSLSESMTPKENFDFINAYLKRMSPLILKNRGFIDKFLGDGIMALFEGNPADAVIAAVAMQTYLFEYNRHRASHGYQPIEVGIGLHKGNLMLGTIGGEDRMDGTVISDAVNLASRIEGLTKIYGMKIAASEEIIMSLPDGKDFKHRFVDKVKVQGKTKAVSVIEIFEADEPRIRDLKTQTQENFTEAVKLYFLRRFEEARNLMQKVSSLNPADKAAQIYLTRIDYYSNKGLSDDWDGIESAAK